MTHRIMLRLKNTSTIIRNCTDFPTKEAAHNFITVMNTLLGENPIIIFSAQKY